MFLYFLHFLYIYIAKISRAFGDLEAKIKELGGNPKVLISEPEIKQFKLTNNLDFILLGCDGIFDKMTNIEAIKKVWDGVQSSKTTNIHKQCGICVNKLLEFSMIRRSQDNITAVIIALKNLEMVLLQRQT